MWTRKTVQKNNGAKSYGGKRWKERAVYKLWLIKTLKYRVQFSVHILFFVNTGTFYEDILPSVAPVKSLLEILRRKRDMITDSVVGLRGEYVVYRLLLGIPRGINC